MQLYNLYHDGTFSGTTDNPDNLPGDGWSAVPVEKDTAAIAVATEPTVEPVLDPTLATVEPVNGFIGSDLFTAARAAAHRRPAVATELAVALHAQQTGDNELLSDAIATLEELLK